MNETGHISDPLGPIEYKKHPDTERRTLLWGEYSLDAEGCVDYRDGLITLRNDALQSGNMEWAVYLSHMIVGWGMMSRWLFGVEYERSLSLAETSKKSQAATAAPSDIRNDSEGGEANGDSRDPADQDRQLDPSAPDAEGSKT